VNAVTTPASLATAAAAAIGLVFTVVEGLPDSLAALEAERTRFAAMSAQEREQAFGLLIPTRMDIFDFYRRSLREDDRYYLQVEDEAFGAFASKATVVRSVARYYLAPAVEVERPEEATVVLSYDTDPALLPLRYSDQVRAGLQLLFVSRVAR
jgi:hypothetical protein